MFVTTLALMVAQAAATPAAPARPAAPQPVTKALIQNQSKATFDLFDANKDGWVDRAEAQKGMDASNAKRRTDEVNATFARLDANKDGSLTKQEFDALFTPTRPVTKVQWMDSNDTNKDGRVSLAEATASAMATFDKLDTDHNGVVSAAEMKAASRPAAPAK